MAVCLPGKRARCSSPSTGFRASASCSFRVCWPRGAGRSGPSWPSTSSPALRETELAALFAQRVGLLGSEAAEFWLGLLPAKLGRALWADAGLPENARALPASRVAEARRHGQVLAVRGLDALRLEAGSDHRRRPAAGRSRGRFPVQGLSGTLLRGRDAGLRRQLRRLQPPLGLRQRPCRRPQCRQNPRPTALPPEQKKR